MYDVPTVTVSDVPDPLPESTHVLDVREPSEWAAGHIEGAQHIPLQQVPERLADLPTDGRLLVVCKVGGRSAQAVAYLQHQGLDVVNLDGGLVDWADAGRPLVRDDGGTPTV